MTKETYEMLKIYSAMLVNEYIKSEMTLKEFNEKVDELKAIYKDAE